MPVYRMGEVAELVGVSVDTVRRWADAGRFATTRAGGQRVVDGEVLAAFLREGALHEKSAASARNRFPGIVTAVEVDGVVAKVEVQAGPHRVVSLLTSEAVDDLGLRPGVRATAIVKSTDVIVEVR
jgi:molybdopterin-binding protein